MTELSDTFRAGLIAAQSGKKDEARAWFIQTVKQEPANEQAWLWLSSVMPTTEQALKCIEHLLTINPQHQQALEARDILRVRVLLEESSLVRRQPGTPQPQAPAQASFRLGDLLVQQRVLTPQQLDTALREQQRLMRLGKSARLGEVLLNTKVISRDQLAAALRAQIDEVKQSSESSSLVTSLGQYLVSRKYITSAQLARALSLQTEGSRNTRGAKLGDVLVRCGYITQSQLERALIEQAREYELHFR